MNSSSFSLNFGIYFPFWIMLHEAQDTNDVAKSTMTNNEGNYRVWKKRAVSSLGLGLEL